MIKTKFRSINRNTHRNKKTEKIIKELKKYEAGGEKNQLDIIWDKAEDFQVWDIFGNKYIDFTSTIFVTNAGHNRNNQSIIDQSKKLIHSYTFPTKERLDLLKYLYKFTPKFCEKFFLLSTGVETTEAAVRLMKIHGMKINKQKKGIISFNGAFHGKTMMAETLSGKTYPWMQPTCDFHHIEFPINNLSFKNLKPSKIAGIIIESYRGWDAQFCDEHLIQELVHWCNKNNIVVCFDEIQGGLYRTGPQFAYMHYNVEPDLICFGKALANGLPITCVAGSKEVMDTKDPLSSTHSGNPLCCKAALETLKYLDRLNKKILNKKIEIFQTQLKFLQMDHYIHIRKTNSKGMIGAIIFQTKDFADKVTKQCMKKGVLLVNTGKEAVKLGPPLTIKKQAILEAFQVIDETIEECKYA